MLPAMRTLAAAALGTLLLAGCATGPTEPPPLTADHPASPDAAEAPLPARSQALALGESPPPPMMEPMPAMGAMNSGMNGMAGMHHHHGATMPGMGHEAPPTRPGENAAPSAPRWTPATAPATAPDHGGAHEAAPNGQAPPPQPDHAGHGGHP